MSMAVTLATAHQELRIIQRALAVLLVLLLGLLLLLLLRLTLPTRRLPCTRPLPPP